MWKELIRLYEKDQSFLEEILEQENDLFKLNKQMLRATKIKDFFRSKEELNVWRDWLNKGQLNVGPREFGDFQTPPNLAERVCKVILSHNINPTVVIEPTYGKGNFINTSLKYFRDLKKVYGVEIQRHYEYFFKMSRTMLADNLENELNNDCVIEVYHDDFFKHEFPEELLTENDELLVIGNPPWITVAELSRLSSSNIPEKSNLKGFSGIEAMTGKSNFDISEYILMKLLDLLSKVKKGTLAILCKNSITKNIVHLTSRRNWNITTMKLFNFDAKKEFGVATDASLFFVRVGESGKERIQTCEVYNLDDPDSRIRVFGWVNDRFVSDVESYKESYKIDNKCPLVWRSGVKHDCSKIMELKVQDNNELQNGLKEVVDLEDTLVYSLVKSSDLKKETVNQSRKKVIITQSKVGQDTSYIKEASPKLWKYLNEHREHLDKRKSSIYKNNPDFSIFGIGGYSFAPYKVAISGMYKKSKFSLVSPINGKPVMLDDTCYFLSFNRYLDAVFTMLILNSDLVQKFLSSITFLDTKRPYNKDNLMRIDLLKAAKNISFDEILEAIKDYGLCVPAVSEDDYNDFIERLEKQPLSFFKDELEVANSQLALQI